MMVFRRPQFRLAVIALAGGALAFYILQSTGFQPILRAASTVGWRGFLALCFYQFGLFALLGIAWFVLIPVSRGARLSVFIWARMVRDATSELLPFSHLGGIVLGARASVAQGVPQAVAFGSLAADITAEMLAQIAFTVLGISILMASMPHDRLALSVLGSAVLGLISVLACCAAFVVFQRHGQLLTRQLIIRLFPAALPTTESTVSYIQDLYRRPGKMLLSVALHSGGWVASAISTWAALFLIGVHANAWDVLAIESLVCAARSVAFWMPNGLGVQEAAFAAVMPLFGIGAEVGLAVSLLKRARDIAVGTPILLFWQGLGSRKFLQLDRGTAEQRIR
jgi:glycosyltransferase 2 family protein